MSSKTGYDHDALPAGGWPTSCRASVLAGPHGQVCAPATVRDQEASINHLQAKVLARGLGAGDKGARVLREVQDAMLPRFSSVSGRKQNVGLPRFAVHLAANVAVASPPRY